MSKKENIIQKVTQWRVILAIQVIASLILIGLLFKLGALPMLYAIIVIILVALLNVGIFFLMKPSKNKKKGKVRTVIGKFVSILLSVLLLVGSLYIAQVAQGNSLIDAITGANTEITRISVVVMKDSKYKKLSDLKGETIEVNTSAEIDKMKEAIEDLQKEESSIKTKEVDEFAKMADDLYKGTTNAIFVNEAYYAMLEANHPNFETETRVIWYKDITVKTKDISKNVNVTKDPFVVYISGIDTYGSVSTVSRSDVNMILTVNPKTKQILMTSIPRDYYVTLANKGKKDKLTHSGLGGIENTVKTMENFMGIDINYYGRVNFTSVIEIVDALGGINIDSTVAFTGYDGTSFKKGTNHITGKQALEFSRERHAFGGGDNERVHNQRVVMAGMIKKMISPSIITNYSSVLSSINGSFETNMESGDITGLLQMQISDMASWTIVQKQLTGNGKTMTGGAYMPNNKLYYMIPNEASVAENKQAIQNVLAGKPVS